MGYGHSNRQAFYQSIHAAGLARPDISASNARYTLLLSSYNISEQAQTSRQAVVPAPVSVHCMLTFSIDAQILIQSTEPGCIVCQTDAKFADMSAVFKTFSLLTSCSSLQALLDFELELHHVPTAWHFVKGMMV